LVLPDYIHSKGKQFSKLLFKYALELATVEEHSHFVLRDVGRHGNTEWKIAEQSTRDEILCLNCRHMV